MSYEARVYLFGVLALIAVLALPLIALPGCTRAPDDVDRLLEKAALPAKPTSIKPWAPGTREMADSLPLRLAP
ncbi:MAG: hypothetical protein ACM31O_01565 [Bacteroidota bacterium]